MNQEGYSDFRSVSEEEEKLDFNKLVPCRHCQKPIPRDALSCYFCGQAQTNSSGSKKNIWIVVAIAVIAILLAVFTLK